MIAYVSSSLLHGPDKGGVFIAEASELGFRPGLWPREIRTSTKTFHRFAERRTGQGSDANLESVVYLGENGGKLTVFND